jgi:cell division protein FtsI/penicillin-binding protein 2
MDAAVYAKGFLNCIVNKDYKGAYERTYPYAAESLKEEDFINKYKDIFEALKIKSVSYTEGTSAETDMGCTYTYQAKYISETYGDFTQTYTMDLRPYEDTLRVNWNPNLIFPDMDFGDTVTIQTLKGKRGEIFSGDGETLAKNDYADTVIVDLTKAKDYASFGPALVEKLSLKADDLQKDYEKATKNKQDILVVKSYPKDAYDDAAMADLAKITGVSVDKKKYTSLRYYPLKGAAAHIVGYTGAPDEKETKAFKDAGQDVPDLIGQTGLELAFDEKMRGKDGEAVYIRDEKGRVKTTLYKKDPQNGLDLRLTIDSGLQEKAYQLLAENLNEKQSGAVVVLNADTGYVEAAVSWPSFDNNLFCFPIEDSLYKRMFTAKEANKPLINRLTQEWYPPGSSLKPFTIAPSLENGIVTINTAFPYTNSIKKNKWMPGEDFPSYAGTPIKRVENSGTPLKLPNALIHSDNIYFAWAAMKLGQEKMLSYLQKYSLGEAMPFDLPLAKSNIINENEDFSVKLLADTGYGQGQVLVTPVQLAGMYTAFAENGDMKQPILVQALKRENGQAYDTAEETKPGNYKSGVFEGSTLNTLLPLMERVVTEGTGRDARVSGLRIGGKTGTAEIGGDKSREISWFVGFWMEQYDSSIMKGERRLVLVMVDGPSKEGTHPKLAVAKELLKKKT